MQRRECGLNIERHTTYPILYFGISDPPMDFQLFRETENATMISGNSPVLLNAFSKKGLSALRETTPWTMFIDQLNNSRYDHLDNVITNLWHT